MQPERMWNAYFTGECFYGLECENSLNCPGISIKVSNKAGLRAEGYRLHTLHTFSTDGEGPGMVIKICNKALEIRPDVIQSLAKLGIDSTDIVLNLPTDTLNT